MIERYSERERDLSKQRAGGEIIRKVAKVEKITIVRGSRPSDMRQLNKIEFPAYTNCTNTNPPTNTRSSRISFFRYQTISKYLLPEKYPSKQQKHSNGMTLCYLYSPFIIGSPCKIKTQLEDADIFLSLLHKALILKKKKNASFFLDQFEFLLIYNKTRFFFLVWHCLSFTVGCLGFFWWCCYKWFSHLCVSLLLCLPNLHECFSTSLLSRSFAHHRVSILLSFSWPFLRTYLVFYGSPFLYFSLTKSLPLFLDFIVQKGEKK